MATATWDMFETRLAEVLHRLTQRDHTTILVVFAAGQPEAFTQFVCGDDVLLAEASRYHLPKQRGMPREQRKELRQQAKQAANQLRAAGWRKPDALSPNWSYVPKGDAWEAGRTAARLSVAALRDVYRVSELHELRYRAFVQNPNEIGESIVLDDLGIAAEAEPEAEDT